MGLTLHVWWRPKDLVCWIFGATTSFGSVAGAEAPFSTNNENDTRIPDVDAFIDKSFNLGDSASSKATSLSRLPVRTEALGDFGLPTHLFSA